MPEQIAALKKMKFKSLQNDFLIPILIESENYDLSILS